MATKTKTLPFDKWSSLYYKGTLLTAKSFIGVEMNAEKFDRVILTVIDSRDNKEKYDTIAPIDLMINDEIRKRHPGATDASHFTKTGSFVVVSPRR